jgi:hypothetical protein
MIAMKAKEYFDKYKDRVIKLDDKVLNELVKDMNEEVIFLQKQRNAQNDNAIVPILKEVNQKWNALCRMFEKECKQPVLKTDGLMDFWKKHIPELEKIMAFQKIQGGTL